MSLGRLRPALLNGRGLVAGESEVLHAGSSEVLGAAHPSPVISSSSSVRMVVQNSAMPTFPRVANTPNTKPARPAVGRARVSAKTEGSGAETDPIGQLDVALGAWLLSMQNHRRWGSFGKQSGWSRRMKIQAVSGWVKLPRVGLCSGISSRRVVLC